METVFENRYIVTKERYMDWAKNPIKKKYFSFSWVIVLIFTIFMFITLLLSKDYLVSTFYAVLAAFCTYRAFFRTKLLVSRYFQVLATTQGATEWERVIHLGDVITVTDGNSTSQYQWSQVIELLDRKNYLILVFKNGIGIRLEKQGFTNGSYPTFSRYVKDQYPSISQKN